MTIMATWTDFVPGTEREHATHEVELATRADVREFVDLLTRPNTSEAVLMHTGRPLRQHESTGELGSDHHVVVGFFKGFGYVEYTDRDRVSQLVGDSSSPEWRTTMSDHFPAGTGISPAAMVDLIDQFRATSTRPTIVQWRDAPAG
ncbi:Imm1 family immunity protein [Saccharothrix isguenensis]